MSEQDHNHEACRESGEWLTDQETQWMIDWSDRGAAISIFGDLIRARADLECEGAALSAARAEARTATERAAGLEAALDLAMKEHYAGKNHLMPRPDGLLWSAETCNDAPCKAARVALAAPPPARAGE